ncbi:MAG: segregation/condensation protein A [Anaerolineae bacterium]|nr:segregation/condensation protein A [Anaerolineae bacterium]
MEPDHVLAPETRPSYRVRLPVFEGPVSLLLHLIEERELAITAVSLAAVADQYLEYVRTLEEHDGTELAAFIEIAARLLLIKSRLLLPSAAPEDEEEEDAAAALVRRLEEYRRFRQAADWLAERHGLGLELHGREPTLPAEPTLIPRPSSLERLLGALERALSIAEPEAEDAGDVVSPVVVSLPHKLRLVLKRLWRQGVVTFRELIVGASGRSEVVVTFLAVLELVRRRRAEASQATLFGDITVTRAVPGEPPTAPVETLEQVC